MFAGDQYVRYSTADYRYVDPGYPRTIAANLRSEPAFASLPESLESSFEALAPEPGAPGRIAAVWANPSTVFMLIDGRLFTASTERERRHPLTKLGQIRNTIAQSSRVDAAFHDARGATYLVRDDQYVRYRDIGQEFVDPGYPRSLATLLADLFPEASSARLPDAFTHGLDAAFVVDGVFHAFKRGEWLRVTGSGAVPSIERRPIHERWGHLDNPFASAGHVNVRLDAAFVAPTGQLYVFKGPWFARYSDPESAHVDEGYPLAIKDNWGDLPASFEASIDGAWTFAGRVYLARAELYLGFEDAALRRCAAIGPQPFTLRWGPWNAIHLNDVRLLHRYRELARRGEGERSLTELLHAGDADVSSPYESVAGLFGWAVEDLQWLKRRDGFVRRRRPASPEVAFELELLVRIDEILTVATSLGTYPRELYEAIWLPLYAGEGSREQVADTLYRLLGERFPGAEWPVIEREVRDHLAIARRDALVAYAVAHDQRFADARDLSDFLLIDVAMQPCAQTSRIREATAAIQLYFHRYFVNLERLDPKGNSDDLARRELAQYWEWMKSYRVWEANRKVFLHPENFIRPELRDSKTPAFKTLEAELLQAEITDDAAKRVYKHYLDEYSEVSRLAIAGGYVYDDPDSAHDKQLVLFGHTRTNPTRYYYRTAAFVQGRSNSVIWRPWLPVGIEINATRVYPVHAFGRVFVFWAEIETRAASSASATIEVRDVDGGRQVSNRNDVVYVLNIRYSFYNLNEEWIQPQLLRAEVEEREPIDEVELYVESSDRIGDTAHQHIVIGGGYSVGGAGHRRLRFFSLSGDFVTRQIPAPPVPDSRAQFLAGLFAERELAELAAVGEFVPLNTYQASTDGPWFSFDYKGGSFLCKPAEPTLGLDNLPRPLADNDDGLPNWSRIDAAVELPSGERLFFDNANLRYASVVDGVQQVADTRSRWGQIDNAIARDGRIDAAVWMAGSLVLFRGSQYIRYSHGLELADRGGPCSLAGNRDGFPAWDRIHAALDGADGHTYLFGDGVFVRVGHDQAPRSIREVWGRTSVIAKHVVTAAFVHGEHTYIIIGESYLRYTGPRYDVFDSGYPKPATLYTLLEDLGCTNNNASYKRVRIHSAQSRHGAIVLQSSSMIYMLENSQVSSARALNQMMSAILEWGDTTIYFVEQGLHQDGSDMVFPLARSIQAAMVGLDRQAYLFSGGEFITLPLHDLSVSTLTQAIDAWNNPTAAAARWGLSASPITTHNRVDAAFRSKDKTFLITGDSYVRYTGADYQLIDEGYPKLLAGNPDGLPQWSHIDAAVELDGHTLFFRDQVYVSSDALEQERPIVPRFGAIANNVLERGVDAAWVADGRLFLASGNELLSYQLGADPIGRFADPGTPTFYGDTTSVRLINAAMSLRGRIFLFAGPDYVALAPGQRPSTGLELRPIVGNWGNLHAEHRNGFDATLTTADRLYVFKGGEYCRYALDDDEEAEPYEIQAARFDIIRLTTSTASTLSERLFTGGIERLLGVESQQLDETPAFSAITSSPTTIQINSDRIATLPVSSHLDFDSANGIYYWEIFFHAPFLIAQSLNTGQKFAQAKAWYEHVFDPTDPGDYWKFLPFLTADTRALVEAAEDKLEQLRALGVDLATVEPLYDAYNTQLLALQDAFAGHRNLSDAEREVLEQLAGQPLVDLRAAVASLRSGSPRADVLAEVAKLRRSLMELVELVGRLAKTYAAMLTSEAQLATYLDDPFDPHAIATLRRIAYRKAIVMRYVDNLLDWGDLLFSQYTMESIHEARMLYMLAQDLLGRRPQTTGARAMSADRDYRQLHDLGDDYEFLLYLESGLDPAEARLTHAGTLHDSIVDTAYFHIPQNREFVDYWDRVEDRLHKIRHCLNLYGERQPLPLFEPPIDPMALVLAAASGGGLAGIEAARLTATPHYRFTFLIDKARSLVSRVSQLGDDLLAALDRKDSEHLSRLTTEQDGEIRALTLRVREAQLDEARASLASLREARRQAEVRERTYSDWIDDGFSPWEIAQMSLMSAGVVSHAVSAISHAIAAAGGSAPDALVGPFIMGVKYGGTNANAIFDSIAAVTEAAGEGLSIAGELLGVVGQHQRLEAEWKLQRDLASVDIAQIDQQIAGANAQISALEHEVAIAKQEIEHNRAIATFYTSKFTNEQLYQWMAGRLSTVHYQTYRLALDMARSAERAYQYERGLSERDVAFIHAHYWDSQRKGLLAGAQLGLDIDRMEQAFIDSDVRRLEIGKDISLLELDPLAFLELKARGVCEFQLGEALFDADFPGHYRRQLKTIALVFDVAEGVYVNATLTQLTDRTVLEPDVKAIQFLLAPKDRAPTSIRSNWRSRQQVALSRHDPYEDNNGLFELRFDSDRYLPFEGTGAVSSWRLELNGQTTAFDVRDLLDVTIKLKYTAMNGGDTLAEAVRGMLKPYEALRFFDMNYDFAEEWAAFLDDPQTTSFPLPLTRDLFPNLSSSRIFGLFARIDASEGANIRLRINDDPELELRDGRQIDTSGLRVAATGTTVPLTVIGDKRQLRNLNLVVRYQAKAG